MLLSEVLSNSTNSELQVYVAVDPLNGRLVVDITVLLTGWAISSGHDSVNFNSQYIIANLQRENTHPKQLCCTVHLSQ